MLLAPRPASGRPSHSSLRKNVFVVLRVKQLCCIRVFSKNNGRLLLTFSLAHLLVFISAPFCLELFAENVMRYRE